MASMSTSLALQRLSKAAQKAGIQSPAQFESLALRLSRQQERLFSLLLEQGECDNVMVRQTASIGNISECAISLNLKLEVAGDNRRVLCERRPHANKFGERGVLGHWRIAGESKAA